MITPDSEFFRPVFEASNPMIVTNSAGVIMFLNKGAEKVFGYERNELRGQLVEVLIPHRYRQKHPQLRQSFNKQPRVRPMGEGRDLSGLRKDGTEFFLEVGIHPFVSNHKSYILLSIIDITERKKAAAALDSMFDLAPFALLLVNHEGLITRSNQMAHQLFGYTPEQMQDMVIETLIPANFRDQHPQLRQAYSRNPYAKNMGEGRDLYALHADQSQIPVEVGLTPIKFGEESFTLAAVIDITPRKQALRTLEEHALNLARAEEAKSEFIANMSHELRTPLQSILSFAHFGQRKIDIADRDKLLGYFNQIVTSGDQLLDLVNQLLDLSKLEADRMRYEMEAHDLFNLVRTTIEKTKPWGMPKQLNFQPDLPAEAAPVLIDSRRIEQVINNLIANAIKFSDKESTITIVGKLKAASATIEVINNGISIPPKERQLIFQKFFQSSATKTGAGGTGLGLSLCKNIIADHKGEIWCDETEDKQTRFTFELPLACPTTDQAPDASA